MQLPELQICGKMICFFPRVELSLAMAYGWRTGAEVSTKIHIEFIANLLKHDFLIPHPQFVLDIFSNIFIMLFLVF